MKTVHIKILLAILIVGLIFVTVIDPEQNIILDIITFILVIIFAIIDYRTNSVEHIKKRSGKLILVGIFLVIISTILEILIAK